MTITELAVKKAKQSISKFRISAIGLNTKGEIVASATNAPKFNRRGGGIHAEEKLFRIAKRRGIKTIIICRISTRKSMNILPIDPCLSCAATAKKLGIKIISIEGKQNNKSK